MDFHLATPTGDVYLFSYDGHRVQILLADVAPIATAPEPSAVEPEHPTHAPT